MNFFHFPLAFSEALTRDLQADYRLFSQTLEDRKFLPEDFLSGLAFRLRQALNALQLADWERFSQNAHVGHTLAHLTHDDFQILNLPWELALGEAEHLFVSRGPNLRATTEPAAFPPRADGQPLRILVMVSAPESPGEDGRLRYETEQTQIAEAFGPLLRRGDIEVRFTDDGSLAALRRALDAPPFDIFHFSGHSEYEVADWSDPAAREGFVLLEDELSMAPRRVPAADFAAALNERPDRMPALVFLSACQSAQGSSGSGFTGLAGRLLEAGFPGVVAMGQSVTDIFATLFAAEFYKSIAAGLSVPLSFSKALKISRKGNGDDNLPRAFWVSQSLVPKLFLTQKLERLATNAPAKNQKPRSENFFRQGPLREKLQKMQVFAGRPEGDFLFIGRRREQKAVQTAFAAQRTVFLHGQGGIGKTALAVHAAERWLLAEPNVAQVFTFDETSFRIEQVTNALLDFLQNEQRQILRAHQIRSMDKAWDKFLTALQEAIDRSKPLFVFDNLESFQPDENGGDFRPEHGMEQQIIEVLAQAGLPLLLTGRYPLPKLPNLQTVQLREPLRSDFYIKCRYLAIGKQIPQGAAGQPLFETLFKSFGGNYRALEWFDRLFLEKKEAFDPTLQALEGFIEKHGAQPELLARLSENLVFERLLALLSAPERRALALLAHFRRPVLPLAVEMQDPELAEAPACLERLNALTLAEKSPGATPDTAHLSFFYVPTLTRLLLGRRLAEDFSDERAGAYFEFVDENINHTTLGDLEEAFSHFVRAEKVDKVNKTGNRLSNFLYKNSQFQNALLVAAQVWETCGEETAGTVLNLLGLIFHLFGKGDEALFFLEKSLADNHKRGDRAGEGATLNNISQIYMAKGDYDTALRYLEQSLKIRQAIGDRAGEGTTLNNISQIYMARGDYDTALRYLEQSLKIRQAIGDRAGEGTTLNNISQIYKARGDYDTALRYLEQSLKIQQAIGDRAGEGATLNNISQIYDAKGDYDTALRYLEQSLKIRQAIGDRAGEGTTLNNLSQIYDAKGDYDTALRYLEQSLKIQQAIGDRAGEGATLNNISQIYKARGDYDTALRYLEQSLKITQAIGDRAGEGATLNNISQIYDARGDYDTALRYLEQSLKIQQAIGDRAGEGTTLNNISQIYKARGDYDTALRYLEQSLKITQAIGDRAGEGATLNNISQIYDARGDYDTALRYLEQSLKIQQAIGDRAGEGATLNNISQIYDARGDYDTALRYLEQSLKIRQAIGDRAGEGTTLNNLATTAHAKGDYDTALRYLEQSLKIRQAIGDRAGEGATLNNLATTAHAKGDYDTALRYLEQSLKIRQAIGDRAGMCPTLHNMAMIYLNQKEDLNGFLETETGAFQIAQEIGNVQGVFEIGRVLGQVLCQSGAAEHGLPILKMAFQAGQRAGFPGTQQLEAAIHHFENQ